MATGQPPDAVELADNKRKCEDRLWVTSKRSKNPTSVRKTAVTIVDDLINDVFHKLPKDFTGVSLIQLEVFSSAQAHTLKQEPLRLDLQVSDIQAAATLDEPLYIHFEDPSEGVPVHTKSLDAIEIPVAAELVQQSALKTLAGKTRTLIDRKAALECLHAYVDAVSKGSTAADFHSDGGKGWLICATVGATGMGKSALLEQFARDQAKIPNRKALYVQFNTDFCVPKHFWMLVKGKAEFCLCAALFHAAGVDSNSLEKQLPEDASPTDVIAKIRLGHSMAEEDVLVVCIDELLQIGNQELRTEFISLCMQLQGSMKGKFVVAFTAFADKQVEGWTFKSGRQVYPIHVVPPTGAELINLLKTELTEVLQTKADDAQWKQVQQWVDAEDKKNALAIIATHPRSLFEGFVAQAKKQVATVSVLHFIARVFGRINRFDEILNEGRSVLWRWLTAGQDHLGSDHLLVQDGLVREDPERPSNQIIAPFLVRAIAYNDHDATKERGVLQTIFDIDVGITKETRVLAQDVVMHFEYLQRCLHKDDAVSLANLFPYATIVGDSHAMYRLSKAGTTPDIKTFNHFAARAVDLWAVLEAGHIAKSARQDEYGIEYISPLFDHDRLAAALCVQVKGGRELPKHKQERLKQDTACDVLLSWALECAQKALHQYEQKPVILIPVLIMVANAEPVSAEERGPAVQVIGTQVAQWLQLLSPLQWLQA